LWLVSCKSMIAGDALDDGGKSAAGKNSLAAFEFSKGSVLLTRAGSKHRHSLSVPLEGKMP